MAEEQSPQAKPTPKPALYQPGDYFFSGGKKYVYSMNGVNIGTGRLNYEWKEVPLSFALPAKGKLVETPSGIIADATGYSFEEQRVNSTGDKKASSGRINLKTLPSVA